jgi:hypothetical protein
MARFILHQLSGFWVIRLLDQIPYSAFRITKRKTSARLGEFRARPLRNVAPKEREAICALA